MLTQNPDFLRRDAHLLARQALQEIIPVLLSFINLSLLDLVLQPVAERPAALV